ncbi:hypothetical protein BGX26_003187 [Mortierella sp. AD094]|nr:hypothetical protein BGX26_003187 [Mortierella sp. AD094]
METTTTTTTTTAELPTTTTTADPPTTTESATTLEPTTTTASPTTTTTTTVPPITTTTTDPPKRPLLPQQQFLRPTTSHSSSNTNPPPYTTISNSDSAAITTTTTINSESVVSPTIQAEERDHSGLSGGAIAGIAIGCAVVLAALVAALFLFKRRQSRMKMDNTLNSLFNPVNLDMQENHHHHLRNDLSPPTSSSSPLRSNDRFNDIVDGSEVLQAINAHDSPEPLNGVMIGTGGISAAGGHGSMYPYENNQQYLSHQDVDGNGLSYMPPSEPMYGHYNDGRYGHYDAEYMTPEQQDQEAAYYQEQLYQQQMQHERELHAPVTYYDPRTHSDAYYPEHAYAEDAMQQEHLYELQQQLRHHGHEDAVLADLPVPPSEHHSLRGDTVERSAASSTVATPRPGSEVETVRHSVISDGEIDADNSKSEPWPDNRDSIASSSSMADTHSPKRNPQLVRTVADESK